jgi:catecholate siderophore receptor
MRSVHQAASHTIARPSFRISRRAAATTTLFISSAVGFPAAFAQTDGIDQAGGKGAADNDEIIVTGVRSVVNDRLGGSVQDTPQSITIVSAKTLQEEAATRLEDALKNVPGITLNSGEGAARGDTVNLRGFPAYNDFFLDGVRDAAVYTRDSFDLETLEVLKGPSAVLFGRGSTGGVINQVSKAPTLAALDEGVLQFGTNSMERATGDIDAPISPSSAIRLNVMAERSAVTDRNDVLNRRYGFAPAVALGVNEPDSLVFAYLHQQENDRPDVGAPFVNGSPAPAPRNADFGLLSDHFKTSVDVGTLRLKHEFDQDFSIANTSRVGVYTFNDQFAAPNFGGVVPTVSTPLSAITVGRDAPSSSGTQTNLTDQLDFTAHFATGPLGHVATIGMEAGRQTNDLARFQNPFNTNNNWIPRTPLLDPNPAEPLPAVEPVTSSQRTKADITAAYINDTIHVLDSVDVIGGLRFDRFAARFDQYAIATAATTTLARTDNVTSPRAALVFKPTDAQRYYFSYGTSFDPSAEALSLTAKTTSLGPVKAKSYEAGAKTDWLNGELSVTGALFRIEVDNAQTNDPDHPSVTILAGNQRVNGFEAGVTGHITQDWEILAGYTYLDAKTIAAGTPAYVGKFLMNTARNAVNLWTEYYLSSEWEVGTGGNFLGRRYADIANTASITSYFVWNGMVTYKVNDRLSFQVNASNLLDKVYYDNSYFTSAAENHVIPGAGRTFTFTARAHF